MSFLFFPGSLKKIESGVVTGSAETYVDVAGLVGDSVGSFFWPPT